MYQNDSSIFSFANVWWPSHSAELNHLSNSGVKWAMSEILKSGYWPRRCRLKDFFLLLTLVAILFRVAIILAFLIKEHNSNILVIFFLTQPLS